MLLWIFLVYVSVFTPINAGNITSKIYDGRTAGNDHPWLAWLSFDGNLICHASLVAKRWVLLPASCVSNISSEHLGKIRVILGDRDRQLPDGEQTNRAILVKTHPDFVPGVLDSDLALIKLKRRAAVKRKWLAVVPNLAKIKTETNIVVGQRIKCRIAGWGDDIVEGQQTDVFKLQYRFVRFESTNTCNTITGFNPEKNLCYTGFPCTGDEGTPIICYMNKNWVQVGMHLFGRPQDGCTTGQKVSLSIAAFRTWIHDTIQAN